MPKYEMREAVEADNDLLNQLIAETPQSDEIVINFERLPCFFDGTRVTTKQNDVWVYKDIGKERLIGVFSLGFREIYVNGQKRSIRYANDLRIHPDYRGSRSLLTIFKKTREILSDNEWMQTIILAENQQSLSTVSSGRAGLPTYYPYGEIKTHLISSSKPRPLLNSSFFIRHATSSDIECMQKFFNEEAPKKQFYPHYEFTDVLAGDSYYKDISLEDYFLAFDGDELVGISGVWNQKSFKQTRFVQYRGKMRWLRHLYNSYSHMAGGVVLPKEGSALNFVYLHSTLTKDNRMDVFEALFARIYQYCNQHGVFAIVGGFSTDDTLAGVFNFYKSKVMLSRQYLISYDGDPRSTLDQASLPYVDVARL